MRGPSAVCIRPGGETACSIEYGRGRAIAVTLQPFGDASSTATVACASSERAGAAELIANASLNFSSAFFGSFLNSDCASPTTAAYGSVSGSTLIFARAFAGPDDMAFAPVLVPARTAASGSPGGCNQ